MDDTKLYISFPVHDWVKAVADLNVDLLHIGNWCFENCLLLNPDKTKLIVYGSRQRLQNLPDIRLSLLGKELIPAHIVKDLHVGVTFDSSLTFHRHIMKTVSSCFSSLAQIYRVKHVFDRLTLTTIINTLVFSKLFIALPSGPMQRTLISSSSRQSRTLQPRSSVVPENLTTLLR